MPNSCQTHTFQGFSPVQIMNLHSVLIMETEHFIFLNAAPRCSFIGDVLHVLLETVLILELIRYMYNTSTIMYIMKAMIVP